MFKVQNLPFKTCTLIFPTIAFVGEQVYTPECASCASCIIKCEEVISPFRVTIEVPSNSEFNA